MGTLKRRKVLLLPAEVPTPEVEAMAFNYDSKGIAVLSREPDAFITIFYFDKAETVACGRVSVSTKPLWIARHVACNLSDTGMVVVTGDYTFKILTRQDKGFTTIGTMTGENRKFTSVIWLTGDVLVAGTAANELVFVEGGDLKAVYPAEIMETIDLSKSKEE